jgi:pimeloyl-ACP methyl ester carboxylesterase
MKLLTEKTFSIHGVSINFAEGPHSGAPLMLLHGLTGSWQSFLSVIPSLAFRYHLYALDFRGHGRSERVPGGYQIENYAQDTIAFLSNQIAEPAVLLGHSLGGLVAIQVAADAGASVRALVLEDPPLFNHRGARMHPQPYDLFTAWRNLAQTEYSMETWLPALASLDPASDAAEVRYRAKTLSQIDPDILSFILDGRASDNYNVDSLLQQIACPVLLVRGEPGLGGVIDVTDAERAASLLKDCTSVFVPGVGHGIHRLQPEVFRRSVTAFLESL